MAYPRLVEAGVGLCTYTPVGLKRYGRYSLLSLTQIMFKDILSGLNKGI